MKVTINPKKLVPDESWQFFRKVRAIIVNENGEIAISKEGGKYIFPGGKCERNENELVAIQREILEETGIRFELSEFKQILELETIYEDFFDYRTQKLRPRHTVTTYYYVKAKTSINEEKMNLTEEEKKLNFKIFFVPKKELFKLLKEDVSELENGKFFAEENNVIVETFLKR